MEASFGFASCVGYHVYQEIWTATEGEMLICTQMTSLGHPFHFQAASVSVLSEKQRGIGLPLCFSDSTDTETSLPSLRRDSIFF